MGESIDHRVKAAAATIKAAEALLITAGAGMGVDSGLPDFRGSEGFWKAYPVVANLGLSFEELANPAWFEQKPHLAWAFYGHRLNLYRRTIPHSGFKELLRMALDKPAGYFVFTSNVDGQFQKAAFDPDHVVECHGSIHHLQCTAACTRDVWDADHEKICVDDELFQALNPLPRCRHCQALARPNVLMFGDWAWVPDRSEVQQHAFAKWLEALTASNRRLVVVELGAGITIPTVRLTSERLAERHGRTLVRINPRDNEVPSGHIGLPFGAAEGIRRIGAFL